MGKELAQELEPEVPQEEIDHATEDTPPVEDVEETPAEPKAEEKPLSKEEEVRRNLNAAVKEERQRRKDLEAKLRQREVEQAQQNAVLQDRLNQLWAAQNPQQGPQLRDPKSDPDPIDALRHNQEITQRAMQELHYRQQTEEAQKRQAEQFTRMAGWARGQVEDFRKENADYDHAYTHMRNLRAKEFEAMGMQQQQILQSLEQDEIWIIQSAAQQGKNPAELIYNMAKNTGYNKAAPQVEGEKKIEALQNGVKASGDLKGSAPGKPTAEQIANMSDEEFEALKANLKKQGKRVSDVI